MKPLRQTETTKGFALVVTLTLMILLTILAVGLLSLSSISLRASNQTAALAEARQNARMALMLALGELQKQAGPDQRSTGAADLAGTTTGDTLAAGGSPANNASINGVSKGLSTVQPGTRYWTGVWRNNLATATAGTEIYTKTPSPKFVQWLISGNETSDTTLYTPATGDCSVGGEWFGARFQEGRGLGGQEHHRSPSLGYARPLRGRAARHDPQNRRSRPA